MRLALSKGALSRIKNAIERSIVFDFGSDVGAGGQYDGWFLAKDAETDAPLGYVMYSIFEDEGYINMVEVKEEYRGEGVGEALINHMLEENDLSYDQVSWGMMTEEGGYLKNKMDSKYAS